MGEKYIDKIELTEEEVNRIKSKAINSLPLNPTAQGWSGSQIRQRMAASITDGEDSLLYNIKEKLHYIKQAFTSLDGSLGSGKRVHLPSKEEPDDIKDGDMWFQIID